MSDSSWLILLDVAGDLFALYLFHRYGREPKPGDPDYIPRVSGRRKAAVTLGVLGGVIGATSIKALTDILKQITGVVRKAATGEQLNILAPACLTYALIATLFTAGSVILSTTFLR